jgi:hypothetical protein
MSAAIHCSVLASAINAGVPLLLLGLLYRQVSRSSCVHVRVRSFAASWLEWRLPQRGRLRDPGVRQALGILYSGYRQVRALPIDD